MLPCGSASPPVICVQACKGFWIFLTCLTLGTAAIAIIGSLSASIERGLDEQGQPLLGGDVEFSLIHREATHSGTELHCRQRHGQQGGDTPRHGRSTRHNNPG